MSARDKCVVREGRFVDQCDGLSELTDNVAPAFSRKKGIFHQSLTNMATMQPSRSMVGILCDAYPKGGFLFNFCPICGTDISAPFTADDEAPVKEPVA